MCLLRWERLRYFVLRMANGFSLAWALCAAAGARLEWLKGRASLLVLAACGLSAFLVFPEPNIVHTHYQLPILFAVAPLAGMGLAALVEALTSRVPRWRYALLTFCLAGGTGWGFQVARWSHFPLELHQLEAAQELESIPQTGPQLF